MRVLMTGASSFTGAWFARALIAHGAEVVCASRGPENDGDGLRSARIAMLGRRVEWHFGCRFGSRRFRDLLRRRGPFDLLALHGAAVGDHRHPGFDPITALAENLHGLEPVLDELERDRRGTLLVTGTLFEADEGHGEAPLRSFSAYGLSKSWTWHGFRHAAERRHITLGKFTIGHPFGPYEKPGLCSHLIEGWMRGACPRVRHPQLVRDHVPVDLLAELYARFAFELVEMRGTLRCNPSCFAEPIGHFVARLAAAMRPRLRMPCVFALADPPEPSDEPRVRFNPEPVEKWLEGWDFERSWDRLATWYRDGRQPTRYLEAAAAGR